MGIQQLRFWVHMQHAPGVFSGHPHVEMNWQCGFVYSKKNAFVKQEFCLRRGPGQFLVQNGETFL